MCILDHGASVRCSYLHHFTLIRAWVITAWVFSITPDRLNYLITISLDMNYCYAVGDGIEVADEWRMMCVYGTNPFFRNSIRLWEWKSFSSQCSRAREWAHGRIHKKTDRQYERFFEWDIYLHVNLTANIDRCGLNQDWTNKLISPDEWSRIRRMNSIFLVAVANGWPTSMINICLWFCRQQTISL